MVLISSEWFQYGSHSPKHAVSLPSLSFIYFIFLFLTPHLTFLLLLTSNNPVLFICSRLLFFFWTFQRCNCLILGWPEIPHLGMHCSERSGMTSHFPGFIPERWGGGKLWRRTRVERNEKTLKPQTVAEGSSLTCQGYTSAVRPDACCIKGADVQDMYPLKQIPTSEDGLKNTHRPMRSSFFHFFITHGAYVSVSFPETQ